MDDIFYNVSHPAGFSGITALSTATAKPRASVKRYLDAQPSYRAFKVPRKKFKRARVKVPSMGVQFQADLFDLQKLGWHNKGHKWIVLVVDAFSRFVKCQPAKNKSGPEIARALDVIFTELTHENRKGPHAYLISDLGNEFHNRHVTEIYKKHNLSQFPLRPPIKCGFAEISGRYIVNRLYKIMHHRKVKRWIDVLQAAVTAKNMRKNPKTAGLSPVEINYDNQVIVHKSLYPKDEEQKPFTLKIGDRVQVVKNRTPFAKSYHSYYSDQVYRVIRLHPTSVPRYSIADEADGQPIYGTWYANELYQFR